MFLQRHGRARASDTGFDFEFECNLAAIAKHMHVQDSRELLDLVETNKEEVVLQLLPRQCKSIFDVQSSVILLEFGKFVFPDLKLLELDDYGEIHAVGRDQNEVVHGEDTLCEEVDGFADAQNGRMEVVLDDIAFVC